MPLHSYPVLTRRSTTDLSTPKPYLQRCPALHATQQPRRATPTVAWPVFGRSQPLIKVLSQLGSAYDAVHPPVSPPPVDAHLHHQPLSSLCPAFELPSKPGFLARVAYPWELDVQPAFDAVHPSMLIAVAVTATLIPFAPIVLTTEDLAYFLLQKLLSQPPHTQLDQSGRWACASPPDRKLSAHLSQPIA